MFLHKICKRYSNIEANYIRNKIYVYVLHSIKALLFKLIYIYLFISIEMSIGLLNVSGSATGSARDGNSKSSKSVTPIYESSAELTPEKNKTCRNAVAVKINKFWWT